MSTTNRLFLAVPVRLYDYPQIRHEFDPLLQGRWRDEETLHITVAFLGKRFAADALIAVLDSFEWAFEPSELEGWDYFSRSRVFVATTQNPTLQNLYDHLSPLLGLESALLKPHATLMRVKALNDAEAFYLRINTPPPEPLGVLEPKVILYRSILYPEGAQYHPLKEWPL